MGRASHSERHTAAGKVQLTAAPGTLTLETACGGGGARFVPITERLHCAP